MEHDRKIQPSKHLVSVLAVSLTLYEQLRRSVPEIAGSSSVHISTVWLLSIRRTVSTSRWLLSTHAGLLSINSGLLTVVARLDRTVSMRICID